MTSPYTADIELLMSAASAWRAAEAHRLIRMTSPGGLNNAPEEALAMNKAIELVKIALSGMENHLKDTVATAE